MIFALVGFQLFFTGGRDHHLDEFGVLEQNGVLTVGFNDKNDDDVFGYAVDYVWLPPSLVLATGQGSGSARGGQSIAVPTLGTKVIRGFSFNFANSDHHLRDIGVLLSSSGIDVFYGDQNADDLFNWRVRWASLRPEVLVFPTVALSDPY